MSKNMITYTWEDKDGFLCSLPLADIKVINKKCVYIHGLPNDFQYEE